MFCFEKEFISLSYTATFLVGAHRFGVPFPKLQTFFGIFWVPPINYSLWKNNTKNFALFVYFQSYNNKNKFLFLLTVQSRCSTSFVNKPFLRKMLVPFFSFNVPLYIRFGCKNYVRFLKWNLNRTPQSAQNSFLRKSNLKFCIVFNMISFASA